jgi:hypothetical protein
MLMGRSFKIALAGGLVAAVGCVSLGVSAQRANAQASVTVISTSQWFSSSAGIEHAVGQLLNNGPAPVGQVTVNLNFYSSSNVLVGTGTAEAMVDGLYAGEKSPFELDFSPPAGYDHFTVASVTSSPLVSPPNHNFTTVVTSQYVDASGNTHISGTVTNNNAITAYVVAPVFTFFNSAGTAVATGETYVENAPLLGDPISPGGSADFTGVSLFPSDLVLDTSDPAFPAYSSSSIITQSGTAPSPIPHFRLVPGAATDIAVGANGSVWAVGTNPVPGGFGIWHWNGSGWNEAPGGAVRIAVDPAGNPEVVNSQHHAFYWDGSGWILYPGGATDIAIGANGSVWAVGTNPVPGGFGIWHWTGSSWTEAPGGAVRIAVDPAGNPEVVNSQHRAFYWNGSGWILYPGAGVGISVGANAQVWVLGTNPTGVGNGLYFWVGDMDSAWVSVPGSAVAIAVGSNGIPWITNSRNQIYAG